MEVVIASILSSTSIGSLASGSGPNVASSIHPWLSPYDADLHFKNPGIDATVLFREYAEHGLRRTWPLLPSPTIPRPPPPLPSGESVTCRNLSKERLMILLDFFHQKVRPLSEFNIHLHSYLFTLDSNPL